MHRYSPTSESGTIGKSWPAIERKGTRTTPRIVGIPFVNSATIVIWTTTSSWSTYGEITTSAISVMRMERRSTTGRKITSGPRASPTWGFSFFCGTDVVSAHSDYQYLSEHFRESHYLCEEGRCSSEQFTHAFRTEIDYKAHKAAAHSKSRAEARQNRQIDIQFTYAPRQQRRNESTSLLKLYYQIRVDGTCNGPFVSSRFDCWRRLRGSGSLQPTEAGKRSSPRRTAECPELEI